MAYEVSALKVAAVAVGWDGDHLALETATSADDPGARTTLVWTYHPTTGAPLEQHHRHTTGAGSDLGANSDGVDTGVHALLNDLAGAPTELIDPTTGAITGTVTTTLFGTTRTAGTTTPHRFTGQHHDPETGLHYNRHRYYNPHTTTYTTPDPLGHAPNPDCNHAYVHSPLTWVDPLGLQKCIPNARSYTDLTKGGSIRNIGANTTHTEFAETLTNGGWMLSVSACDDQGVSD